MSVSKPASNRFRIGFLPFAKTIKFSEGEITPIPEYARVWSEVESRLNLDGFLYPPSSWQTTMGFAEGSKPEIVPKSERPAFLYPVYPSHDLALDQHASQSDMRFGIAGFVLHLLAFIFRTRLQFTDWHLDGRVSIKGHGSAMNPVRVQDPVWLGDYVSQACSIWKAWPQEEQTRFTSILYMFSRGMSHEWEWEEFMIQYTVSDACWRMSEKLFSLTSKGHRNRIKAMCDHFGLTQIDTIVDIEKLVELRNELFHEALWVGERPGASDMRSLGYSPAMKLWFLNEQLIRSFLRLDP